MAGARHTPVVSEAALDRLYARSDAARWGLTRPALAEAVQRSVAKQLAQAGQLVAPDPSAVDRAADGLHAQDLALACACADGSEAAWDHFVLTYRPELYRAARAMTDEATGRELADSLYADLFGLDEKDGARRSLFRYYHGRAKLSTWLRSVLAQRHVDHVRAQRRLTSLDDPEHPLEARLPAAPAADPVDANARRAAADAIGAALAVLAADDRVRLAFYYAHGLTLAQAGRLFGESEATASRKLERARLALRAGIEKALAARGLGLADVDSWRTVAREAWDAALVDAFGVPDPQERGTPTFKVGRTP